MISSALMMDIYTMHLLVTTGLWVMIVLFYWQYRACCKALKNKKNLQDQNEELSVFVYGAAHDLKAPLRAIEQIAGRLQGELADIATDDQQASMLLLQQRAKRASRLVDDLLEYWQAGKSWIKQHSHMTNAYHLVQECVQIISPPPAFQLLLDPSLEQARVFHLPLQQVMINLIGNAVKHHHKKSGVISIRMREEKNHYLFFISDDGPGVPDDYKEKIFETFEVLKSRDDVEGSGLGLSLVKRIVTRQGGEVFVKDAVGGGSIFVFSWPKKQVF